MWCRDASYALRHVVNARDRQMLAEVSGGTCEVVLRGAISRSELRLLTRPPNRQGKCSHGETRDLRSVQPRPWLASLNLARN